MRSTLRLLSSSAASVQYPRSKTIGFVGLGAMGKEMATNLLTKTFSEDASTSFVVCDVDPNSVTRFITTQGSLYPNRRILPSTSPASLSKLCGTIVTMLPSSPQVKDVYLGEDGIQTGLQDSVQGSSTLCIDCTTCDRQTGVDVSRVVRENSSNSMIDAPVSGGVAGASAGTLTFLVGSDDQLAFESAQPHLLKMGARTIHCGPNGTGLSAKIANNLALGINMLATAEAMALGIWGGISPETMAHILNTSTGKSWSSEVNNPVPGALRNTGKPLPPAERDYTGGFASRLQAKDLKLALQAAEQLELPTPMGLLASRIYDTIAARDEYKDKDFSVAFKALIESSEAIKAQKAEGGEVGNKK